MTNTTRTARFLPHRARITVLAVLCTVAVLFAGQPVAAAPECRPNKPCEGTGGGTSPDSGAVATPPVQFTGSLSKNTPSATHVVRFSGGVAEAALTFTRASSLSLQIRSTSGDAVANATGPSVLHLSADVEPGDYELVVSGADRASYTLDVTETAQAPSPSPSPTPSPSPDSSAPTLTITSPEPSATITGAATFHGTASDDVGVALVEVRPAGGLWAPADGDTEWSKTVDTTTLPDGDTVFDVRAADAAGNHTVRSVTVRIANASAPPDEDQVVISDPASQYGLEPVSRGRTAEWGQLTVVLYGEGSTAGRGAYVRSAETGQSTYVRLSADPYGAWSNADYVMSSERDLWVLAGTGPVYLRHYRFSGSPLPTAAELVEIQTFGDTDSKAGHLTALRSGALLGVWHQRGFSGPQGIRVAYLRPGMATQFVSLDFMPTRSSRQVVVQHPADDSVWLFNSTDAWGSLGAAQLSETADGLRVEWTDPYYISEQKHGDNGPDPEHPDLAVNADPATGTIALAYQSRTRKFFSSDPVLVGSQPVVARIEASGSMAFTKLPVYVERISSLALTVGPDATWLAYRPINETALTADELHVSVDRGSGWSSPRSLGTLVNRNARISYGVSRPEFSALMKDGTMRLFLTDAQ